MAEKTATICLDITFDDQVTDAESLAIALDRLLETALSTPGILDDYGNPTIGMTYLLDEDQEKLTPAPVEMEFGRVLCGAIFTLVNPSDPVQVGCRFMKLNTGHDHEGVGRFNAVVVSEDRQAGELRLFGEDQLVRVNDPGLDADMVWLAQHLGLDSRHFKSDEELANSIISTIVGDHAARGLNKELIRLAQQLGLDAGTYAAEADLSAAIWQKIKERGTGGHGQGQS